MQRSATFGDVAEHAPWVAAEAEAERPFATRDAMITAFANAIAEGDPERQMALLQAQGFKSVKKAGG